MFSRAEQTFRVLFAASLALPCAACNVSVVVAVPQQGFRL